MERKEGVSMEGLTKNEWKKEKEDNVMKCGGGKKGREGSYEEEGRVWRCGTRGTSECFSGDGSYNKKGKKLLRISV